MTATGTTGHADFVVIGLGALGSATCLELARSGHRVVGLERFGLGHSWGASHDTSRILRHSYHTPEYVRLTQQAYGDWARLERDAGTSLVSVVGGLDLFPPEPAISPVDYTESLDEVGIEYELLTAAGVMNRWPQFRLPDGPDRAPPGRRRDRAGGTGHPGDAGPGAVARCRAPRAQSRPRRTRPGVARVRGRHPAGSAALRRDRGVRRRVGQRRTH